jgi:hypothetical protein
MSKKNLLGKESLAEKMLKLKQEMNVEESERKEKQPSKEKVIPKLFISGRLDRKKHAYTAKSLILLTKLEDEIKVYCRGGDLAILNYLIKEGLKKVKASDTPINVEMEEIESDII